MPVLGFELWETWADALLLRHNHPSKRAVDHLYRNLIDGVRISPLHFESWDRYPEDVLRIRSLFAAARDRGLKTMLVPDWHNPPFAADGYHTYRYFPQAGVRVAVTAMLEELEPDVLEVCNEPNYGGAAGAMPVSVYTNLVRDYARAAIDAQWMGRILATNSRLDGWEQDGGARWEDVETYRPIGVSEHPFITHRPPGDLNAWRDQIRGVLGNGMRRGLPLWDTEHTSVGKYVDINTQHGADLVRVAVQEYSRVGVPLTWLIMGGTNVPPNAKYKTWLVDGQGNYSKGALAMMDELDVEPLSDDGTDGQNLDQKIANAVADLRKNNKRLILKIARRLRSLENAAES